MSVPIFIAVWVLACIFLVLVLSWYARQVVDVGPGVADDHTAVLDTVATVEIDWATFDRLRSHWAKVESLKRRD